MAFHREPWKHRRKMRSFYSQFVSTGDLVFDIGANIGRYTETFLGLGARVVAVEPNPHCVRILERVRHPQAPIIEAVAVGDTVGIATLHLSDWDALSTLSNDWKQMATKQYGREWPRSIEVPVVTLDSLIGKYGAPRFLKIDVEGFEAQVFGGLSHLPELVSFEVLTDFLDSATACLAMECFSEDVRYNLILRESLSYCLSEWVTKENLVAVLNDRNVMGSASWGEVFARSQP